MQETKLFKMKHTVLILSLALMACSPSPEKEKVRDVYVNKAQCIKEWNNIQACEQTNALSGGHAGHSYSHAYYGYVGPSYYPHQRSYNGFTPKTNLSSHKVSNFSGFHRSTAFKVAPIGTQKVLNYSLNWNITKSAQTSSFKGNQIKSPNNISKITTKSSVSRVGISSSSRGGFGRGGSAGGARGGGG